MVGSSGKYGEYNSLRRDIPSEIYLFNIIMYLFAFSNNGIIFFPSSIFLFKLINI
jgi:hypothetical protein